MAPGRKSRSVNRRFSNEISPEKDVGNSGKGKQRKKKLADKLGPQWSKGELERFYDAYRKHGQDWRKVAAVVRNNRSIDMVEALFNMNRAYLSLPEGTASVAGLIAMMTDHYSVMEGSDSEGEGHDASGAPRKYQKRKRAKSQPSDSREDANPPHSIASTDGCLSFLKRAQAYGTQGRATGKRTPRIPVQSSYKKDDREGYSPPNKRARKSLDANDDVAHILAFGLTDASKKGESAKVSGSTYRRTALSDSSPIKSRGKMSQPREAQSKLRDSSMYEEWAEGNRERKYEKDASDRDATLLRDMEGVGTVEVLRKGRKFYGKKVKVEEAESNNSDDSGEACSATEGLRTKSQKGKVDVEPLRGKCSPRVPKKRNKKPLFSDEFDALQALAELSASMLPAALMESESSAQIKEERTANDMDDKSSTPEATSTSHHEEKAKQAEPKENTHNVVSAGAITNSRKPKCARQSSTDGNSVPEGKQKPQPTTSTLRRKRKPKILDAEAPTDSNQNKSMSNKEPGQEENIKSLAKTKRAGQVSAQSKQLKTAKTVRESSPASDQKRPVADVPASTLQVSASSPVVLPQKPPNRRKMSLKKMFQERAKSSEITPKAPHSYGSLPENECLKEKLSAYLSYPLARKWCIYEWFYSAIDYPWFAKMEFVDYLNHVGLGHVPRLTRLEWSVIKSSLGRPRRFSVRFLEEEMEKLNQYRESVRKHYTELRTGAREGLATDLPRPLSVGDRVIAIHPKTQEIHDGKILTVDHNKCSVLFDRADLGVVFVMDTECMPSNLMEYMPEALRRPMFLSDKCLLTSKEAQLSVPPNLGVSFMFPSSGLENVSFPMNPPAKQGDTNGVMLQSKASGTNAPGVLRATNNQPYITIYGKAREAEIQRALILHRTLDEKELEPEMLEIVKGSRSKAQAMVDAAIKAASSVKEGEDASKRIQEALDSIGKHQTISSSMVHGMKHQEDANGSVDHRSQSPSDPSEPLINSTKSRDGSGKNEMQTPSELITSCVATWLMIQMCTERQYPPADVAQLIDAAVTSLHPRCPQNLPLYREIQMCMGRIKTQILALIPT